MIFRRIRKNELIRKVRASKYILTPRFSELSLGSGKRIPTPYKHRTHAAIDIHQFIGIFGRWLFWQDLDQIAIDLSLPLGCDPIVSLFGGRESVAELLLSVELGNSFILIRMSEPGEPTDFIEPSQNVSDLKPAWSAYMIIADQLLDVTNILKYLKYSM